MSVDLENIFQSEFENSHKGKFFGTYIGIIKNSNDPEQRGRVRMMMPELFGDNKDAPLTEWAEMQQHAGGIDAGSMITPEEDLENDIVCSVQFLNGDPQKPIVTGYLNAGQKDLNDVPQECKFTCDGTKCSSCSDKKAGHLDQKEHKKFHNHEDQFYCPKKKVLYKSPNGTTIEIDERGETEGFRLIDSAGQILEFFAPVKKDKREKRGTRTAKEGNQFDTENDITDEGAYIKLIDLANQFINFSNKFGEELVHIRNQKKDGSNFHDVIISCKEGEELYKVLQNVNGSIQSFEINAPDKFIKMLGENGSYYNIDSGNGKIETYSTGNIITNADGNFDQTIQGYQYFASSGETRFTAPTVRIRGNLILEGFGGSGGNWTAIYDNRNETANNTINQHAANTQNISAGNNLNFSSSRIDLNGDVYINGVKQLGD